MSAKPEKIDASQAKAAAVKASKKRKAWWHVYLSRRTMIISGCFIVAAVLFQWLYNREPEIPLHRQREAQQAFLSGNSFFEQGDIATAVMMYRSAITSNPKHADAWCNLGNALSSALQYSTERREALYAEAIRAYENSISVNPQHVEAHFNMGVLHHTLDNVEEAISSYEKALALDAQHYDALSNLGSARHKQQDLDGAIDAYQRALEIVGELDGSVVDQGQVSMLYYLLGAALSSLPPHRCKDIPCGEHAANKLRQALRHNPNNEEAKHALSALVADPSITEASASYITSLFDEYAATFDQALVRGLHYQAPELLWRLVASEAEAHKRGSFGMVLDAGCGTGLCGPLFRNISHHIIGLDLSPEMIEKARERMVYDELEVAEIGAALGKYQNKKEAALFRQLELIVAADVFVYQGDLARLFKACALSLKKGGWFAFTLERLEKISPEEAAKAEAEGQEKGPVEVAADKAVPAPAAKEPPEDPAHNLPAQVYAVTDEDLERGWKLQLSGRFAHTEEYVVKMAKANNFKVLSQTRIVPRIDNGVEIPGQLLLLEVTA